MATETAYHRYIIKSRKVAGTWNARAIRGKTVVGPVYSGATEEAAILAVQAALDVDRHRQRALRGTDGYPTATEVKAALDTISMTDEQRAMLNAHLDAEDHVMTATELANAGSYDSYVAANSQYGRLGRKLAEELEWEPPLIEGVPIWTFALATGVDESGRVDADEVDEGHWQWKLRPEVIEASKAAGGSRLDKPPDSTASFF